MTNAFLRRLTFDIEGQEFRHRLEHAESSGCFWNDLHVGCSTYETRCQHGSCHRRLKRHGNLLLLVGPIFIPFFVVPKMDWLFWGWFKAFLQYSFYQVVANAFVFIFAKLLLAFFAIDTGGMTVDQWMTAFPAMFIFLLIAMDCSRFPP